MATAKFRFYEELNDFLPPDRRKVEFSHHFERRTSIKDMIESFGVPHPEIDLILVNGRSVDFSCIVADGDRVSVYPVFECLDISPLQHLRPEPLRNPRFVVDCNLGRLARYLRLLGLDTLYRNNYTDEEVADISRQQQRIILTRDRRLLLRKIISHGLFVRAVQPREQVREVLARLDLYRKVRPFTRCTHCNAMLHSVEKQRIEKDLQPKTRKYYQRFMQCPDCNRIYWQGSHHDRSQRLIDKLTAIP
ncbi:MAG TPA: twitching motility protein PilT [Gammaproteobacteria bacterium]|nr:twitching motility protein PilT [Gammaproteobacteria bacterium]